MGLVEVKKKFFIDVAVSLFLERGIDNVTIEDIAKTASVGEMTIYRYFGKKQNIVFEAVLYLQNNVLKDFFRLDSVATGYDKLNVFYNSYLEVFKSRPNYFRFIREFDLLMINSDDNLHQYEEGLEVFKSAYFDAYELGRKDGTVKEVENLELFYFTSTHALIELCKKLSYGKNIVSLDEKTNSLDEINCLIKTFLAMLKNS